MDDVKVRIWEVLKKERVVEFFQLFQSLQESGYEEEQIREALSKLGEMGMFEYLPTHENLSIVITSEGLRIAKEEIEKL